MPRAYRALAAFLQPSASRPETGGTRPCEAPLPVSEPVLGLRGPGGIVGVLEDWRAAVFEARGWGRPVVRGTVEDRVYRAAADLRLGVPWVARYWGPAGDLAREVRELERDVLSIVDPPDQTYRVGPCPAPQADGTVCGAILRAPKLGVAVITCRWCRSEFGADRWLVLAAAQEAGGTA